MFVIKISIITTNYNTDKYLEQTIRNILSQKGDFDLEYIITDGGSKDNSLKIIKKYYQEVKKGKWGRRVVLRFLSEKDNGQSDGINKGLKMVTGDIVAFLNADDLYTEGALDRVVRYFKNNPDCMWLTGYCKIIDENNNEIRKYITEYKNRGLRKLSMKSLLIEDTISQPATFWRHSLMEQVGYLDESLHYAMDHDYWVRMEQISHMHLIKEYLAMFRFTSNTKTGSSIYKTLAESKFIAQKYSNSRWILFRQWLSNQKRIFIYKGSDLLKKLLRK